MEFSFLYLYYLQQYLYYITNMHVSILYIWEFLQIQPLIGLVD